VVSQPRKGEGVDALKIAVVECIKGRLISLAHPLDEQIV
jgi:hypothetical protein